MKPGQATVTLYAICWRILFAFAAGPFDISGARSRGARVCFGVAGK